MTDEQVIQWMKTDCPKVPRSTYTKMQKETYERALDALDYQAVMKTLIEQGVGLEVTRESIRNAEETFQKLPISQWADVQKSISIAIRCMAMMDVVIQETLKTKEATK